MLRTFWLALLLFSVSGTAWAGTFSLDFNDESAQFGYVQSLTQEAYGNSLAGVRLLYNDDTETILGTVGFGVQGSPGNIPGLKTSILVSINGSDTDGEAMLAVALGLMVDYVPHALEGLGVSAGIRYAPDIFTFIDAENYLETFVGVRYTIMPNAALTLAYQNIRIDFDEYDDVRVDDSVRIGVRFDF